MSETLRTTLLENEPKRHVGLGVIILNANSGHIWTIEELDTRESKDRKHGQLSVPLETRKQGETFHRNLLGALAEAYDDQDADGNDIRDKLSRSIFQLNEVVSFFSKAVIFANEKNVFICDLAILIYDGPDIKPCAYNKEEVKSLGWMPVGEFLASNIRPLAKKLVETAYNLGHIDKALDAYHYASHGNGKKPLLDSGFSIRDYYNSRERLPDV